VRVGEAFGSRDEDVIVALFTEDAEMESAFWEPESGRAQLSASHGGCPRDRTLRRRGHVQAVLRPHVDLMGFYADGSTGVVEERISAMLPNGASYVRGAQRQVFAKGHPMMDEPGCVDAIQMRPAKLSWRSFSVTTKRGAPEELTPSPLWYTMALSGHAGRGRIHRR
jgi:hypothetical protein